MSEEKKDNQESDGAVDMTGVKNAEKSVDKEILANERELREEAKKNAKPIAKGAFVVVKNLKVDGKRYKRGDVYDGKDYAGIKSHLVTKEEWDKR